MLAIGGGHKQSELASIQIRTRLCQANNSAVFLLQLITVYDAFPFPFPRNNYVDYYLNEIKTTSSIQTFLFLQQKIGKIGKI